VSLKKGFHFDAQAPWHFAKVPFVKALHDVRMWLWNLHTINACLLVARRNIARFSVCTVLTRSTTWN